MTKALGSVIGCAGGLVFVLVNAAGLASGWVWPVRVLGVLAFLVAVWFGVVRGWSAPAGQPPSRTAIRTYGLSVTAMVVLIPLGSLASRRIGHPQLVLPWVVFVVGAHFLPMARAFDAPVFQRLGLTLVGVGVLGAVATLALGLAWVPWTGVAAGFAILAFVASAARSPAP